VNVVLADKSFDLNFYRLTTT